MKERGKMRPEDEIVKIIVEMSGHYSPYVIFSDWVSITALAFQNASVVIHDKTWQERERQYREKIIKYTKKDVLKFIQMNDLLTVAFEMEIDDYLGKIYMSAGCGSKNTGQFFTPFHLAKLTTRLSEYHIADGKSFFMNEPSCGGGGMILATAKMLKDRGVNYQRYMKVVAQDLDWNSIYMTYIQLSLAGIDAIVVQGDSLKDMSIHDRPESCIFRTLKNMEGF